MILFNGQGGEYQAVLESVTRQHAWAHILSFSDQERESTLPITLAQSIAKGERMDYTVQKAVELGVQRIVPIMSERSVVKLNQERQQKRLQHWRAVAVAACEQSGRNRLVQITEPQSFASWLSDYHPQQHHWILHPGAQQGLKTHTLPRHHIRLLIGPEGGFSAAEIAAAEAAGYLSVHLGPRILRTETAAVVALAVIQTLWGDLG